MVQHEHQWIRMERSLILRSLVIFVGLSSIGRILHIYTFRFRLHNSRCTGRCRIGLLNNIGLAFPTRYWWWKSFENGIKLIWNASWIGLNWIRRSSNTLIISYLFQIYSHKYIYISLCVGTQIMITLYHFACQLVSTNLLILIEI